MSDAEIQELKQKLNANPPSVIFNYLKTLISMIINLNTPNGNNSSDSESTIEKQKIKKYEKQLQTLESECRNHIRMEQQLKLIVEAMQQKTEELKKKNEKYKNMYQETLTKLEAEKQNSEKFKRMMEEKELKENKQFLMKSVYEDSGKEKKQENSDLLEPSNQKDIKNIKGRFKPLNNCISSIFDNKKSLDNNKLKYGSKRISPNKIKSNLKENINYYTFMKKVSIDKFQPNQNNESSINNQIKYNLHPSELKKIALHRSKNSNLFSKKYSNIYQSMNISKVGSRKVSIKKSSSLLSKKSKSKSEINYTCSFPKKESLNDIFNCSSDQTYIKSNDKINKSVMKKNLFNECNPTSNRLLRGKTFLTGKHTDSQKRKSGLNPFDYFKYKK